VPGGAVAKRHAKEKRVALLHHLELPHIGVRGHDRELQRVNGHAAQVEHVLRAAFK